MKNKGFSIIELMVVVAIVGILAAIAIPAYQDSVRKSNRADAQGALQQFRQAMERHYSKRYTYEGAAQGGGDTGIPQIFSEKSPIDGGATKYNLTIQAADNNTFTLRATPVDDQANDECGTLELTNTGERSADGTGTRCWDD
jgi:type IV pilus assembly protein PilE